LHTEKRILTNTALLGFGEAVGQLAAFVFVVVCARSYGTGVLGWYSLSMSVGGIAAVLVKLGTQGLLLRDLSQNPEQSAKRIGGTLPYQAVLSVLAWAGVAAFSLVFVDVPVGRWIIVLVAFYHLASSLTGLRLIGLQARQIMWPGALASAAQRVLIVAVVAPLALLGLPAEKAFLAFPAATLLVVAGVFVLADRAHPVAWKANTPSEQRRVYSAALPFFGTAILGALYVRLGLLMIATIAGENSAGIYSAADRLLLVVGIFQGLFVGALFPAVAHLASVDRRRALELSNRCMRLLLVFSVPVAGIVAIFHREIILLLFGTAFAQSAPVLAVLAPAFVLKGVNGLWAAQAAAIGLQHRVVRARGIGLGVFVVSAAALIPPSGPLGLAVAVLIAESTFAAVLRSALLREGFAARVSAVAWKPALSVIVGAAAYLAAAGTPLPIRAGCVALATAVAIFLLGAVRGHDLRYLRSILARGGSS
jgi:O-antigen/teichoic acid export membrane protein